MTPTLVLLASLLLAAGATPAGGTVIDLTHPFDEKTVYWPTQPGFIHEMDMARMTEFGFWYASGHFAASEHGGTHIDAPFHFWKEGATVDAIPADQLIGPGVLVDVSEACGKSRDYLVRVKDLLGWEERHGRMPEGAIVLLRTGFGAFYPDRTRYMGTDERGEEAVEKLHFPGLDPEAARWLATARSIGAVGLDTPSIDHGPSTGFAAHVALFERGVPALENVAALDRLPESGFTVIALPMKIRGGTGAPLRIVAIVP